MTVAAADHFQGCCLEGAKPFGEDSSSRAKFNFSCWSGKAMSAKMKLTFEAETAGMEFE